MSDSLFLNTSGERCFVSPSAVLSILNAHKRRKEQDSPVIGLLLGERDNERIYVKEAYAILSQVAEDGAIHYNIKYFQELTSLLKSAYRNLEVVGLYADCVLDQRIAVLYEYFLSEFSRDDIILLTIDTSLKTNSLDIAAYSAPLVVEFNNTIIHSRYERMPVEIHSTEADKIALSSLTDTNAVADNSDSSLILIQNNHQASIEEALKVFNNNIGVLASGDESMFYNDKEAYGKLVEAICSIPTINKATFDKTYGSNLDDMLLVAFLASLTRTQVALSDNANSLI